MRAVLRFLGSRWFLSFLGVALLGVLVWLFGPFLSFLEDWIPRAIVIAVMLLVWAGVNIWLDRRRRKNEAALVAGVTAVQADPTAAASAEEVAAMRDKLTTALALLKKASGSRGYLYRAAVVRDHRPARRRQDHRAAERRSVVPARRRDGPERCRRRRRHAHVRLVVHRERGADRHRRPLHHAGFRRAVDKAGWLAFLGLLKRTRARQPLNGVLVAIALSDIAAAPAAERLAHARAIRRRVKELYDQLGVRVPVYALFTKADLIAGFTEFFDDLDRERRGQVWGVTLSAEQVRRRHRRAVRRRVQAAGRAAEPAPARPAADRAQPRTPHADRRLSRPGRPASPPRSASSSPMRSAGPGSIRRRCCAASTSPRARRKARRSIA